MGNCFGPSQQDPEPLLGADHIVPPDYHYQSAEITQYVLHPAKAADVTSTLPFTEQNQGWAMDVPNWARQEEREVDNDGGVRFRWRKMCPVGRGIKAEAFLTVTYWKSSLKTWERVKQNADSTEPLSDREKNGHALKCCSRTIYLPDKKLKIEYGCPVAYMDSYGMLLQQCLDSAQFSGFQHFL